MSCPVEDRDSIALLGNVERQIRSHDRQTDQSDFCLFHDKPPICHSGRMLWHSDGKTASLTQAESGSLTGPCSKRVGSGKALKSSRIRREKRQGQDNQ
jgi:hypothetical protein